MLNSNHHSLFAAKSVLVMSADVCGSCGSVWMQKNCPTLPTETGTLGHGGTNRFAVTAPTTRWAPFLSYVARGLD